MASNKKERKKKIYDCSTEEGYFEYREIVYEKYQYIDLDSLKHIKFMTEIKLEYKRKLDLNIIVTLIIMLITISFELIMKVLDISSPALNKILLTVCMILVFILVFRIGRELIKSNDFINEGVSMLRIENQVIQELIEEKSKPHKFYNEIF